ncbi:unnamed protein product [Notodromas monacha]|uniref:Uncharacterized protein n=1 Tax=Notodromas monacha TaxID=399045 RepID=A0A7R9C388_9CRUS|nr:unnamed protein product [Notodromas monacha]CAG0925330.1 unnamed protein product [Notodromas monacha]
MTLSNWWIERNADGKIIRNEDFIKWQGNNDWRTRSLMITEAGTVEVDETLLNTHQNTKPVIFKHNCEMGKGAVFHHAYPSKFEYIRVKSFESLKHELESGHWIQGSANFSTCSTHITGLLEIMNLDFQSFENYRIDREEQISATIYGVPEFGSSVEFIFHSMLGNGDQVDVIFTEPRLSQSYKIQCSLAKNVHLVTQRFNDAEMLAENATDSGFGKSATVLIRTEACGNRNESDDSLSNTISAWKVPQWMTSQTGELALEKPYPEIASDLGPNPDTTNQSITIFEASSRTVSINDWKNLTKIWNDGGIFTVEIKLEQCKNLGINAQEHQGRQETIAFTILSSYLSSEEYIGASKPGVTHFEEETWITQHFIIITLNNGSETIYVNALKFSANNYDFQQLQSQFYDCGSFLDSSVVLGYNVGPPGVSQ